MTAHSNAAGLALRAAGQDTGRRGDILAAAMTKGGDGNRRQLTLLSSATMLEESGPPRAGFYAVLAIFLFIIGGALWSAVVPVVTTSVAAGSVVPAGQVQTVQHLEGGIVQSVLVQEGDLVEVGQPLAQLNPVANNADLDQMMVRHAALSVEVERLRAQSMGLEPDFDAFIHDYPEIAFDQIAIYELWVDSLNGQSAILDSQLAQRELEVQTLEGRVESLEQQVNVVGRQLAMQQQLEAQGWGSRARRLEVESAYVRTVGELEEARGNILSAMQGVEEIRQQQTELELTQRNQSANELGRVATELAELDESIRRFEDRVERLAIRAPVRGVINLVAIGGGGGVLAPGATVAEIVPVDGVLEVEARLKPSDVGYVTVGQTAEIIIEGFDVSRYGMVPGRVVRVSASTFVDEEGQSYYKAIIALDETGVGEGVDRHEIVPGMQAQVSINIGEHSLLSYMVKPVYNALNSAFGER